MADFPPSLLEPLRSVLAYMDAEYQSLIESNRDDECERASSPAFDHARNLREWLSSTYGTPAPGFEIVIKHPDGTETRMSPGGDTA